MTDYSAIDFTAGATIPPPAAATAFGGSLVEGNTFYVTAGTLYLKGFKWWVAASGGQSTAPQAFCLWQATGTGAGTFVPGSKITSGTLSPGLNTILYPTPIPLSQGCVYTAATGLPGAFPFTSPYWTNAAYSSGLTNGPLVMPAGVTGSQPPGISILQSGFNTTTGDPTAHYPDTGNNNFQCWLDVLVTNVDPGGGSYRIWPNQPKPVADLTGTDAAVIALQFSLSQQATPKIWHYSPPAATVLPTGAAIWNVGTQTAVAQTSSATWSGAIGSGWVSCTNLPAVTLQPSTNYKVSVFSGVAGATWFLATTNYWGTGPGAAGRVNGILTAPNNATASPGQGSFNTSGTFVYPQSIDNENYWIDIEVTPAAGASGTGTAAITLAASAVGGQSHRSGTGTAALSLAARATTPAPAPAVQKASGGWWQLLDVYKQAEEEFDWWADNAPFACPRDGEPLRNAPPADSGSSVEKYCTFCGFEYPRDWVRPQRL